MVVMLHRFALCVIKLISAEAATRSILTLRVIQARVCRGREEELMRLRVKWVSVLGTIECGIALLRRRSVTNFLELNSRFFIVGRYRCIHGAESGRGLRLTRDAWWL